MAAGREMVSCTCGLMAGGGYLANVQGRVSCTCGHGRGGDHANVDATGVYVKSRSTFNRGIR